MAMAGEVIQQVLGSPAALQLRASSMQARTAWQDSDAGMMPSLRANITPASKVAICGTATASMSFSCDRAGR